MSYDILELNALIDKIHSDLKTKATRIGKLDNHKTYLEACMKEITIDDGLFLEFGVYRGKSITHIANNTDKTVYGFDSFEGLPEDWDPQNPKGVFSLNGEVPPGALAGKDPGMYSREQATEIIQWAENIKFVKGWFDETLPDFTVEHEGKKVSFLNIDSDLYSSAKIVLESLKPMIVDGTIITFDEIVDYPDYRNHEIKAFAEFLLDTGMDYDCLYHQVNFFGSEMSSYNQGCFRIKSGK